MYLQNLIWTVLSLFIFSCHYFIFPWDAAYGYGHLYRLLIGPKPETSVNGLVLYLMYGVFNTYVTTKTYFGLGFIPDTLSLCFFVFSPIIAKEIKIGSATNSYKSIGALRKIPNLPFCYRTLQILLTLFIESHGLMVVVGMVLMLKLSVCIQLSLRYQWKVLINILRVLLIGSLIVGNGIWMCSMHMLGRLSVSSKKSIKSWMKINNKTVFLGSRKELRYMKAFTRSCPCLKIGYCNVYHVKRASMLLYVKQVSRATLKSMLAIQKFHFEN